MAVVRRTDKRFKAPKPEHLLRLVAIAFRLIGDLTAVRGSEAVPVSDTVKTRVHNVVEERAKAIAEPEADAHLVVGFELSAAQEHLFQICASFREVNLVMNELKEAANLYGKPSRNANFEFRIKLKTVERQIVQVLRSVDAYFDPAPWLNNFVLCVEKILRKQLFDLIVDRRVLIGNVRAACAVGNRQLSPVRLAVRVEADITHVISRNVILTRGFFVGLEFLGG